MSKFRSGNNKLLLTSIFFEESYDDTSMVLYSLKDQDHRGYQSLYRLYIEMEDLTEWEFANTYLEGWDHWQRLCKCSWFKPLITRWRKELELKLKARALRAIQAEAAGDGKNSYMANKFLVEKGWIERPEGKRGRPTKEEIQDVFTSRDIKEDLERVSLQ